MEGRTAEKIALTNTAAEALTECKYKLAGLRVVFSAAYILLSRRLQCSEYKKNVNLAHLLREKALILYIMVTVINNIPIAFKPSNHDLTTSWQEWSPPTKQILPAGFRKASGRRPLDQAIIFEKDLPITLRDGVTIYADVFRPTSSDEEAHTVPAVLAWSPYGKQGNGMQSLDRVPWRAGVPRENTSDLEKFEGLDPAEWCPRGYAIVNVDSRGVGNSDGDMYMLGSQVSCHAVMLDG